MAYVHDTPGTIPTTRPLRRSQLHHAAVMTWTQLPVLHALCAKTSLLPEAKLRLHVCVQRPGGNYGGGRRFLGCIYVIYIYIYIHIYSFIIFHLHIMYDDVYYDV